MPSQSLALSFRTYVWLADTIYRAGYITREEIDRRWAANLSINPHGSKSIPERTFHKWRHAVEELFGINIECSRLRGGAYYIQNASEMKEGEMRNWLISTFAVSNLISESSDLKNQIIFEDIPSGQRFLTLIIEAMRDKRCVRAVHQSFGGEAKERILKPYCVKLYAKRWYVLAQNEEVAGPRTYALDRFEKMELTEAHYRMPVGFDPASYYADRFGISNINNLPAQIVRIRLEQSQVQYLKTLPLHISQTELENSGEYSVFEFFLVPNIEFVQALRKYGRQLTVLSPQWLRTSFADEAAAMLKLY